MLCFASLARADISFDERPFDIPNGVYQASFIEEVDGISVIRFSGDYSKSLSNGDVNAAARAVVAREFYQTHSDDYDFLVIFTDFEFDTGDARAFHLGVSNDVEGVGKPLFSNSELYGSESRLKGYIDMANIDRHEANSLEIDFRGGDDFSFTLRVLAHETLHQWGISSGIEALQGRDDGHWSFFMDTDASIEYGHSWRDNEDGTFTAEAARLRFSQLDLYLMGLAKKEDVPDFYVINPIDGTEFSKDDLPRPGVTISGTRENFSINDLITVNGPRKPAFSDSQKVFRYGFIYLTSSEGSSRSATVDDDLGKIRQIRAEYEDRFSVLTGGRAIAQVYPPTRLTTSTDSADEIESEGVVDGQGEGSIEKALTWLAAKQSDDGSFSDRESTAVRDSDRVLSTLSKSGVVVGAQQRAREWFTEIEPQNTDSLARKLTALEGQSSLESDIVNALHESQNNDGGWGLNDGLNSSVIDTALVMCSLSRSSANLSNNAITSAFSFLVNAQNEDGGWSVSSDSASSVSITARVLSALACSNRDLEERAQSAALNWLLAQRKIDDGFGDSNSSVHESAEVILAFIAMQQLELLDIELITTYIASQQSSLGDWSGSVYVTALVVEALQSSSVTNLSISEINVSDPEIYSGEIVELVAHIENDTAQNASPTSVEFSYLDASSNMVVFDSLNIPEIPSMRTLEVRSYLDTSNIEGTLKVTVNVDPANNLIERSSQDNQKEISLEILSSPDRPELSVSDQTFEISPNQIATLPKLLTAQASIKNIGKLLAENIKVQLWQGIPNSPEALMLSQRLTSISGLSTRVEVFEIDHQRIGETEYTILVDSDDQFAELNEADNRASRIVETIESVDLAIVEDSLSVDSSTLFLGQSVNINATIENRGTTSSPTSKVELIVRNSDGEQLLQEADVSLEPGETRPLTTFWVVDFDGTSTVELRVDSENLVPEVDEQNNTSSINIESSLAQGNNLSVNFSDLQFNPNPGLEGMGATLSALIRNSGTSNISTATIEFYDGNPATGGQLIGATQVVNLESEASRLVSVVWGAVPDNNDRFIYVVIDPQNQLEEISEDDNIAFEKFNVISLPDFAVSGQSIMTTPEFPRINQETVFSIRVTNRGNQREEALPINVYLGGADIGSLIASGEITIEGDGDAVFEFKYTFEEFESTEISVVVDHENVIRESSELNNTGNRRFTIQEGDFYLSDLYLSPDDNGDKDSVEYFFNLSQAAEVSVVVTNIRDEIVREFHVSDQAITSGSVEWDGKNEFGGLVADGRYQFSVRDQLGVRQGERAFTVDTNRSPLANAINTQFALERNLSCRFGQVWEFPGDVIYRERLLESVIYGPNDQFVYFPTYLEPSLDDQGELLTTNEDVLFPSGIYQAQNDGSQVIQLVADRAVADSEIGMSDPVSLYVTDVLHIKISPDNKRMLVQTRFENQFWVVDIETGELKRARHEELRYGNVDDIQFISDEVAIFKSGTDSVFAIDTSSMTFTKLVELTGTTNSSSDTKLVVNKSKTHALLPFSNTPYTSQVELFNLFDDSYSFPLALIDLQTRDVSVVANNVTGFSWSPNGDRFVVGVPSENSLNLFDTDGVEVQRIPFSKDQSLGYSNAQRDQLNNFFGGLVGQSLLEETRYAGDFGHFSWAPDGSEFAFVAYDYIATLIESDGCSIRNDFNEEFSSELHTPNFFTLVLSFFTGVAHAQEDGVDGMLRCYQISPEILSLFNSYKTTDGIYVANLRSSSIEKVARTNTIAFNGVIDLNSDSSTDQSGLDFPILPTDLNELRFQNIDGVTVNENGIPLTDEGLVYVEIAGQEDFFRLYLERNGAGRRVAELTPRGIEWLEGARELLVSGAINIPVSLAGEPFEEEFEEEFGGIQIAFIESGGNQTFVLNLDSPEADSRFIFEDKNVRKRVKQTNTGKFLNWFSNDQADQCFSNGETNGYRQFQSLLNLTADLRARRVNDSGGFLLEGSAADQNFDSYILEFADVTQPDSWTAIAPASSNFVIDDRFTTWVAPYIGRFLIRLTVFDLAGNSRQEIVQVSNAEQASISSLFTSEQFISPNGDGIQDATALNFRVLKNVNLDLRVFDSNEQLVRSIQRSFDVIGSEQAIEWNGRDSSGQVVPDGQYRLLIQNFEFFVTVDNSAPVLADDTELLFIPPYNTPAKQCRFIAEEPIPLEINSLQDCKVITNRAIRGSVSDLTLQQLSLQYRERSSSVWKASPNSFLSKSGQRISDEFSIEDFRESEFRLLASDLAGNTSILNVGDRKLGFAHIVEFPDYQGGFNTRNSFGYASQSDFGVDPNFRAIRMLDPESNTRVLRYQHSVVEEVQFVELLFKESSSDEEYESISVTPTPTETRTDLQEAFDVTFDASTLGENIASFDVKIRLRLKGGRVIDTDTVSLARDTSYLELNNLFRDQSILLPGVLAKVETNIRAAQIERLVLVLASTGAREDSRFSDTADVVHEVQFTNGLGLLDTAVNTQELLGAVIFDQEKPVFTEALDPRPGFGLVSSLNYENPDLGLIGECDFSYKLTALLYTTGSAEPVEENASVEGACTEALIDIDPVFSPSCSGVVSGAVDIHYFARPINGVVTNEVQPVLLRVGTPSESGSIDNNLLSVNLPKLEEIYTLRLNAFQFPEGELELRSILVLESGATLVEDFTVPIVHQAPMVNVTYPANDTKICAVEYRPSEGGRTFAGVEVQGRIKSTGPRVGMSMELLGIELDSNGSSSTRVSSNSFSAPSSGPRLIDYIQDNLAGPSNEAPNNLGKPSFLTRVSDDKQIVIAPTQYIEEEFQTNTQGVLAVPKVDFDGKVKFDIEVFDWSGASQCLVVEAEVDGAVEVSLAAIRQLEASEPTHSHEGETPNYKYFSPNSDGSFDEAPFRLTADETIFINANVYATNFDDATGKVSRGDLIAKPYDRFSVSPGELELAWDGTDESGLIVDDGIYDIEFIAEDACGNQFSARRYVGVDTQAPQVEIGFPLGVTELPIELRVLGTVIDARKGQYELSVSQDGSGQVIGAGLIDSFNVLGEWNTFGLSGDWALQLSATDGVGNKATTFETFTIPERQNLITSLTTTEYFVSPNDDGRLDSLTIRVAFERAVTASVSIKTLSGELLNQLSIDTAYTAGFHTLQWDGEVNVDVDVAEIAVDDVYKVEVIAAGSGNVQTEFVQFELDRTPPTVNLSQLSNGYLRLGDDDSVFGSVSDNNFDSYSLSMVAIDENQIRLLAPIELAESTEQVDGVLAEIPEEVFELEQLYLFTALAKDLAGNQTRLTPFLVIDQTPPAITFEEPAADAFFNTETAPVNILGSVKDGFLESYSVVTSPVSDLLTETEVASGSDNIDPLEIEWDIDGLADGAYRIKLSASDQAGLMSSLVRSVVVDNTPPVVAFAQPQELAYITESTRFLGSANDDYFSQYSISIARGHGEQTGSFNEILTSGLSRLNQPLFEWSELPTDGDYSIRLEASDKVGNSRSAVRLVIVDTTPPAAPNLTEVAVAENREDISINWDANSEPDLQGYILFRNGQPVTPVISDIEHLDLALLEGEYTYQVLAVDKAGLRSELSEPLSALIDVTPPLVQILQPRADTTVNLLIDIIGTAFSDNDFKEYRVLVAPVGSPLREIEKSSVPRRASELAQWDTTAISIEGEYLIRLEADDVNGNTGSAEVSVRIDNTPPGAPENLVAEISPLDNDDVVITWDFPSGEPDLLGFLLFRNGELANTNETVLGDLRQFAIDAREFTDRDRPDGTYEYIVYAIDKAGNISAPSNADDVEIDNNAPVAKIVSVTDGQGFGDSLYLLAQTLDNDVAHVLLQFKPELDSAWVDIQLVQSAPFEYQWDTSSIEFGSYNLRAVATDLDGKVDEAPEVLSVIKRDVVPPLKVEGLEISVVGSEGTLSWQASEADDLSSYKLYRAQCVECLPDQFELVDDSITELTYQQLVDLDTVYQYYVTAVDVTGNESIQSDSALGVYGTANVSLLGPQRFLPIEGSVLAQGETPSNSFIASNISIGLPIDEVVVNYSPLVDQASAQNVSVQPPEQSPRIMFDLPTKGGISLSAAVKSEQFNTVTRVSEPINVIAYGTPTAPTGLSAMCAPLAFDEAVNLTWNAADASQDVVGYRLYRNGERVRVGDRFADGPSLIENASAFANVGTSPEAFLPQSPFSQTWVPGDVDGVEFGQTWPNLREVSSLRLNWRSASRSARDFAVDALVDGTYIEVATSFERFSSSTSIQLDRPIATTSIRVRVLQWNFVSQFSPGSLHEMSVFADELIVGTSFQDQGFGFVALPVGEEFAGNEYQIQAVERFSGVSDLSTPIRINCEDAAFEPPIGSGDFTITGVADGSEIVVNWDEISPDLYYRVYLSRAGEGGIEDYYEVFATGQATLDELDNSVYQIFVIAFDDSNELVDVSNTIELLINQPLPMAPINLTATADSTNQVIDLQWETVNDEYVEEFQIYRSSSESNDFIDIGYTFGDEFEYTDTGVQAGVTYSYRVTSFDELYNESEPSNIADAKLDAVVYFPVPVITSATDQYTPLVVSQSSTRITGLAEPDASISLLKNGQFNGNAVRSSSIVSSQDLSSNQLIRFESGVSRANGDAIFLAENDITREVQLWLKSGDSLDLISGPEIADWPRSSRVYLVGPESVLVDRGGQEEKVIYSLDTKQFEVLDLGLPTAGTALISLKSLNQSSETFVFNGFISGQGLGDFLYDRQNLIATRLQGTDYSYSPDGKLLAYLQSSSETGLAILNLESGITETVSLAPYSSSQFSLIDAWSPDASKLLLSPNGSQVIFPPTPNAVPLVVSREPSGGSITPLVSAGLGNAVWAGNNRVAYIDESIDREFGAVVSLLDIVTQTSTELGRVPNDSFGGFARPSHVLLGFEPTLRSGTVIRDFFVSNIIDFRSGGYFEFNDVELDAGENIFSAVAINQSGETSDPAANVSISLQSAPLPDYQLDLELNPAVAALNRGSEISLRVTNSGAVVADLANLSMSAISPDGAVEQLVSQQIGSLAPGASIEVSVSWVPSLVGDYILIAAIDDENLVEELSEANNRRILDIEVRETVLPNINLGLEESSFDNFVFVPNEILHASLSIANPGPVFDGTLAIDVIDEFGAIVEQVELIQVDNLLLGETRSFDVQWNSSPAVLGSYKLRARLIDRENVLIAEQDQSFTLEESLTVLLGLRAQKFSFDANQDVRLTATMINRSDKAVLEQGRLTLNVFDQAGGVLSEQSTDSINVLVGGRLNETFVFPTLDNLAGEYRAEVSLFYGDAELATASTKFEIVLQDRAFIGDLQVARNELSIGESLAYQSDVSNMGNTSIDDLTITYRVEQGLEIVSSEPQLIDQLAVGQQLQEARVFSTSGLPNNRYKLVMLATQTLESGERFTQRLDEEVFSIIENQPPVVSVNEPTNNAIINSLRSSALATVIDDSGVRSVEARFDNDPWFSINTSAFTANSYRIRLSDLNEGEHQISARATDTNGNSSSSVVHDFIVDNTPPNIEFSNLENQQLVIESVTPLIDVSDEHLDRVEMTLNGEPFNASQSIDELGSYTLIVNAFDLAGNAQRASVEFSVIAAALNARDDQIELRRGGLGNVKLLSNDEYRDINDLTIEITEAPSSGSLVKLNTGDYNYYPSLLFIGTDSFTYSVTDTVTKQVSSAKVSVTVRPGASCSFVPDHSVSAVGPVLLPSWARSSGDTQAPRFRIRITDISDIEAFEIEAAPTITFPDCSLSYTPKIDTRKTVKVSYVVEDVASGGERYTSPISTFEISINTKDDNPAIIVPVLQLLLLEEDK